MSNSRKKCILTINGGSSSIKFALYQGDSLTLMMQGKIGRIGLQDSFLDFEDLAKDQKKNQILQAANHTEATRFLVDFLKKKIDLLSLTCIGHRIVHGMSHTKTEAITQAFIEEMRQIIPCAPEHLPGEIELIEALRAQVPDIPQFACFDTEFHANLPVVAKMFALPRRLFLLGVQRYGFHGLSYAYQMRELERLGDAAATNGRVILAHLGNGASLAAVYDGKCIDTSMGFTPAAGLPMSTRSGDLDPGIVGFLTRSEQMSIEQFDHMINHESGLLGISETSSDVRDLLLKATVDARASEAIELFCYQVKKWIGSFVAALGGLDTLVFAGGVGENAPEMRTAICQSLSCFGIEMDETKNSSNADVISPIGSRVTVRIIKTDEEQMIARSVLQTLEANHASTPAVKTNVSVKAH